MLWFGFGFNAFGQIREKLKKGDEGDAAEDVKVVNPVEISCHADGSGCKGRTSSEISEVRASWSRRASLHVDGDSCVCLAGFSTESCGASVAQSRGCRDAVVGESHLSLAFPDRVECWDLQRGEKKTPAWSMEIKAPSDSAGTVGSPTCSPGTVLSLPLVPGGYVSSKPPFYRPISPHLKAKSLALGSEHAILLTATGAVYSWGLGSHGQLGHGGLTSEEEPRAVEALWGMPMSCVSTGGWHTACISEGGDLYMWGWNESGQLGLPSQALRKTQQQSSQQAVSENTSTSADEAKDDGDKEVFISIQAFPALLDISPPCEIKTVGCGSRHTAAVTTTGDLYTWGWGEYGQLGYQASCSDEPQRVEFFRDQQMCVVNVVCGAWNTFAAVVKEEVAVS